jgi:DNA-binding NtrC family response regulator
MVCIVSASSDRWRRQAIARAAPVYGDLWEATSPDELCRLIDDQCPSAIVVDAHWLRTGCLERLRRWKAEQPPDDASLVVVLVDSTTDDFNDLSHDWVDLDVRFLPAEVLSNAGEELLARTLNGALAAVAATPAGSPMVGVSAAMTAVRREITTAIEGQAPILIEGPTGAGKEVVAREIHRLSRRKAGPFIGMNVTSLPASLAMSHLFGHERGAFTGAGDPHRGLFEQADGGTLLLDEIGDLSTELQPVLLRILQDGELRRLGAERARHLDVRVMAATNRPLRSMVESGRFREDLYFRLSGFHFRVPALDERPEDIPVLAQHRVKEINARSDRRSGPALSAGALHALGRCSWPGNVRQLAGFVERLVANAVANGQAMIAAADVERVVASDGDSAPRPVHLREALRALEVDMIKQAARRTGGNMRLAAKLLGEKPTTLYSRLRKLGLPASTFPKTPVSQTTETETF